VAAALWVPVTLSQSMIWSFVLDRTLVWNLRHLMTVLREYKDFYNSHRPHRALDQAAPLRPLPDGVTDLDHFLVRRHDRVGGFIHEYRLVA
jgi:putative transposase